MTDEQLLHREAVHFWRDDVVAMMLEAPAGSAWFDEVADLLDRAHLNGIDPMLAGADIRTVCEDLGISMFQLAKILDVPVPVAYAIGAGWQRLSTRSLFAAASYMGVPVGAFVHDQNFEKHPRVHMYEAWRVINIGGWFESL